MAGQRSTLSWAVDPENAWVASPTDDRAVFTFWYNHLADVPADMLQQLPWLAADGLRSMVGSGGFSAVYLRAFAKFENISEGVQFLPLEDELEFTVASDALNALWGNRKGIVALSDVRRFRACQRSSRDVHTMCDVDTLYVLSAALPSTHGHWFGTHATNPDGRMNSNKARHICRMHVQYCK